MSDALWSVLAVDGPATLGPFAVLAQLADYERDMRVYVLVALGLSIVVFFVVLFFGRRKLEDNDKLKVDWEREEEKMRKLADLRKATRSPEEQRKASTTQPADRVGGMSPMSTPPPSRATVAGTDPQAAPNVPAPAPTVPPSSGDSEFDQLMRGLSD